MDVSSQNFTQRIDELKQLQFAGLNERLIKRFLDLSNDYHFDAGNLKELVFTQQKDGALQLISSILGSLASAPARYDVSDFDDEVYKAEKITKSYGSRSDAFCLDSCDFSLKKGSITGIVGENGNGKTTLLRMIAGELSITTGTSSYGRYEGWENIKNKISYIPQRIPKWYGTLQHNMKYYASIHGVKGKENQEMVDFYIHRLGLEQYKNYSWSEISTGYRLRFQLAKIMLKHPRLLVLDEPLANLDVNAKQYFLEDLQDLARSQANPIAIILSSQQLHDVEMVSDQIIFLKKGKPEYIGKVTDIGKDRECNTFELSGNFELSDLEKLKQVNPGIIIDKKGMTYLIYCPLDFTSKKLLQALAQMDFPIDYLRDISNSTKKYF
jgi:ABC-2 type transport system ATP-binding protein